MNKIYFCPVCGFGLDFEPWINKSPSDEICPSCGTQFGYDDSKRFKGSQDEVAKLYAGLRQRWIAGGMRWSSSKNPFRPEPIPWHPKRQLMNIGIEL